MNPDIRKQIEAAADEYFDVKQEGPNGSGVMKYSAESYDKLSRNMNHRSYFTAGAEFGYGLASEQLAREREIAECKRLDRLALAEKLKDTEDCWKIEADVLRARVKELEAERDTLHNRNVDVTLVAHRNKKIADAFQQAAEDMARALESRTTVAIAQMNEPYIYTTFSAFDELSKAITNYRKLFPKGSTCQIQRDKGLQVMKNYYGKLVDKTDVSVDGSVATLPPEELNQIFDINNRRVAEDQIGEAKISTVFLGINHGWHGRDMWFETMIFGGEHDGHQERYETWEEAEAGHKEAVDLVKSSPKK